MGGLKSWLGFAGSMTGTGEKIMIHDMAISPASGSTVLGDQGHSKPWARGNQGGGGEDTMTKKAEEHMSKIAGDFCNWLRDLPGEDRAINSLSETQLRVNNDRLSYFLFISFPPGSV